MSEPKPVPPGLDERGAALWTRVTTAAKLDDAGEYLLEEACRALDRLERLHWLITGDADTWAKLLPDELPGEMTLNINGALVEARQQQQTFRALLGQLKLGRVALEDLPRRSVVDELASRRAGRGAATSDPRGSAGE